MLRTTAFNTFKESLVQTQYQPTRPGMMITVGRVSDGKLLDSFKTQSRATSPPSNSDNISLRNSNTLTTWTTRTVHAAAVNIVFHTGPATHWHKAQLSQMIMMLNVFYIHVGRSLHSTRQQKHLITR